MNQTKLHIFQIINSLGYSIFKLYYLVMYNLYTKFVRFLEICKLFSNGLVTEKGNILRPGPVPRFSDLEVIALSMAAESEEIDSPQIRNFVCCGLMGWDLIRLVMPMSGIELQIAADVHSYPLPHDAA